MIGFEYEDENPDLVETMSLEEAKSWCRIDQDYPDYDNNIKIHISSARLFLESNLNVGLIKRNVVLNWTGHKVLLPLYPIGEIISVKEGDRLLEPDEYIAGKYKEKTLEVKEVSGSYSDIWYSRTGIVSIDKIRVCESDRMFTAVFEAGYNFIPKKLYEAWATHVVYLYNNEGNPELDENLSGALPMASSFSKNLIL